MIRLLLVLLICYLVYAFYKKPQEKTKVKNPGKAKVAPEGPCPNPKTFADYIEGRIKGKQKEQMRNHIDKCKDCMDALQDIFNVRKVENN